MSIAIVSLGTEVVRGELVNTNSQWLAEAVSDDGFEVSELVSVADDHAQIIECLTRLAGRNDAIVCTGGLGPTTDDLTTEAVAAMLGEPLVLDEASLEHIRQRFRRAGRTMGPSNEKQARFPRGARILSNPEGTAPGFAVTIGQAEAFFMPGVPLEMRAMFEAHVRAALPRRGGESVVHQIRLNTFGQTESAVNDALAGIEAEHGVVLGYRAHFPEIQVKVLARGPDKAAAAARAARVADVVQQRLGPIVFSRGTTSLAGAVGELLEQRGLTLGVAESCTGGWVAQLLTENAGASAYFAGGVVSYANQVKHDVLGVPEELLAAHGAVSQPVAEAMARGAHRVLR
ncbi:MAG TPA: CinA family nicotinamide mononucleotide deamidase-related protein, partial [Polyangiaceae bacterium]